MAVDPDALTARWRRASRAVANVVSAANSPDPDRCPDAVATSLDALYDLWEAWRRTQTSATRKYIDVVVSGDAKAETTAALVHARGGKTHAHVEFGDFTDTVAATVFDHVGCWRWQTFSDPDPHFADRNTWYATHVASREVREPFDDALRWLRQVLPPPPKKALVVKAR